MAMVEAFQDIADIQRYIDTSGIIDTLYWGDQNEYSTVHPPTIDYFRFLCGLPIEMGVYHHDELWIHRTGWNGGVLLDGIPSESKMLCHTHPYRQSSILYALPSVIDFIVAPAGVKNYFVASIDGLVQFWPLVLDVKNNKNDLNKYCRLYKYDDKPPIFGVSEKKQLRDYTKYLEKEGCKWNINPWEEIGTDERLLEILLS